MSVEPELIRITLRVLPRDVSPTLRIRAALKSLLRRFGLRNVGVEVLLPLAGQRTEEEAKGLDERG